MVLQLVAIAAAGFLVDGVQVTEPERPQVARLADDGEIELQFAEKLYSIAQDSYDAARREQEKQQLYLVTVERPNSPEKASYPRIFLDTMTVLIAALVLWSMVALLVASVRDHLGG